MVNSKWQIVTGKPRGFTLIEMLIVFALIGSLTVVGLNSFLSYNRSQTFRTSVTEVTHLLNVAKTRSLSQVKPAACGTQVLRGYQVNFTVPGEDYVLRVLCGTTYYAIQSNKLPSDMSFQAGSATSIFFAVTTGTVTGPQTVTITGDNTSKTITVDTIGNISVE